MSLARSWSGGLSLLMTLGSASASPAETRELRVTASVANIRSGPSTQAGVLFQMKAGEVLTLLEAKGDWYHVETSAGRRGYLFHSLATERVARPAAPPPSASGPPTSSSAGGASQSANGLAILHDGVACVVAGQFTKIEARFDPRRSAWRARAYFRARGTPARSD